MEFWQPILGFPGYSVSSLGRVKNDDTDRVLTLLINQTGVVSVGLMRDRIQYKRSVALLVANAFLPSDKPSTFDTAINVDGDRMNNSVGNLMWRPRWFAVKYNHQFKMRDEIAVRMTIEDTKTGERFRNSWSAAIKYGLLDRDIGEAIRARSHVWPTYQVFRIVVDERRPR